MYKTIDAIINKFGYESFSGIMLILVLIWIALPFIGAYILLHEILNLFKIIKGDV